ncbi:MAG: RIO1 family regulatory kinase/ATPase [bacterium]
MVKSVLHPDVPLLGLLEFQLLKREARALRQLDPLPEVPDLFELRPPESIVMEFRKGRRVREVDHDELGPDFFDQFQRAVDDMHDLGIVHSDLKKKDNLLVSPDLEPVIVDFGTHFRWDAPWGAPYRFLYNQFKEMDLNAVVKLKKDYCPEAVTEDEWERLDSPVFLEKLDRFRRDYLFE